jgi:hypothetical protein
MDLAGEREEEDLVVEARESKQFAKMDISKLSLLLAAAAEAVAAKSVVVVMVVLVVALLARMETRLVSEETSEVGVPRPKAVELAPLVTVVNPTAEQEVLTKMATVATAATVVVAECMFPHEALALAEEEPPPC